jgi:hypothetical protein
VTTERALSVIAKWSACRCRCTRSPTGYCVCVVNTDGVLVGWHGGLMYDENGERMPPVPVADDCDRVTAKDRKGNRK